MCVLYILCRNTWYICMIFMFSIHMAIFREKSRTMVFFPCFRWLRNPICNGLSLLRISSYLDHHVLYHLQFCTGNILYVWWFVGFNMSAILSSLLKYLVELPGCTQVFVSKHICCMCWFSQCSDFGWVFTNQFEIRCLSKGWNFPTYQLSFGQG